MPSALEPLQLEVSVFPREAAEGNGLVFVLFQSPVILTSRVRGLESTLTAYLEPLEFGYREGHLAVLNGSELVEQRRLILGPTDGLCFF
jgi:hypothetical protein